MKTIKTKVTFELDLPMDDNDEVFKFDSKGLIIQTLFDELVNYSICSHLQDAFHWLSKSKGDEQSTQYKIYKSHDFWADLLRKAEQEGKITYDINIS